MSTATAPPPLLHIALITPEIPQNTGNIGRLCVGIGARLHLVRPLGFSLDEKAVRRAGIDHWRRVDLQVHDDQEAFLAWAAGRRVHAFTRHAERCYSQASFEADDVLVFGRESTGLPEGLLRTLTCWRIPVPGPIRSLNLANAVAVVAYRALEAISPALFQG
ncbi:MAG: tRNA (cytidine(34)-2'-O)-methyltransferase [Pseudomonadota bacterium]